jgi:hypothetical protein
VVVVTMMTTKPGFTEALCAFESMRAFMYTHDITKRDQASIVHIESLLFNLKWKGATKKMKINDFLCTFFELVNKHRQIWSFLLI